MPILSHESINARYIILRITEGPKISPLTILQMNNNFLKYESLGRLRSVIALVFMVVGIWYLNWRFSTIVDTAPFFSITLYAAEIYGFCSSLLNVFTCWRLTVRQAPSPLAGKTVDVFIPTYNEPVHLVRKTVIAAINME